MTLILSGTDGLSDIDGSAATPAIRGTDTNTGIFFPAADTIAFSEGGVESMRIDSSGNVGVGTSSPTDTNGFGRVLDIQSSTGAALYVRDSDSPTTLHAYFGFLGSNSTTYVWNKANGSMLFGTNDAERARITSGGNLLINTVSSAAVLTVVGQSGISPCSVTVNANGDSAITIRNSSGTTVGTIVANASTTAYNTSSDYRLKHDITPMTGALAKVAALKPVTYKWNADNSAGEGFIAHELAEVVPQCVTGEKDAVETYTDEEGNEQTRPAYQGIDTSFLVATLTAAIQELKAINDAQAQTIQSLTARIEALEGK